MTISQQIDRKELSGENELTLDGQGEKGSVALADELRLIPEV